MKFCKLADIIDWQDPEFQSVADVLALGDSPNRQHWESIQLYRGLKALGLLQGESIVLGLGVGQNGLMYALANQCHQVVVTEWRQAQSDVQRVNAGIAGVEDAIYDSNVFPYARDRLTVQPMNPTQIDYPDASFDFVWSCGAMEQVNDFRALHQIYQEIHRVLKPGGLAAITTGFNVTDRPVYEPNALLIDRHWMQAWLTGSDPLLQGFELLDQPDFFVADRPENQPAARQPSSSAIQLYRHDVVLNSLALFLRKSGEFSRSYHENWLPTFWQAYLAACEANRAEDFARAEAILNHLTQTAEEEPRLRVRAFRRLAGVLSVQGKSDEVRQSCEAILPDCRMVEDAELLTAVAAYCTQTGLWDAARTLYETIEALPSSSLDDVIQSLLHQAEYYEHQNHWEKVLEVVGKAEQEIMAGSQAEAIYKPKIYFWTGLAYEKMGQLSPAIRFYKLAIEISADHSADQLQCYRQLTACLQTQVKRLKRRIEELEAANPDQGNKFWQLRSRWTAAKGFFKRRTSSSPSS